MARATKSAKTKPASETLEETVQILQIEKVHATFYVLGSSTLVMNRMMKKAREQLLLPPRRKNKAELAQTLKHDPIAEFHESIYRCRDSAAPTLIHLPNGCFKKAIAQAAIDIPGATKAQIGRLVSIADPTVHLYGTPKLYMDVVRLAGPSRAPDIRTRAAFPRWACKVTVGYIRKLVTERDVLNLFAAAGVITGIGDGRPERGARDNGQWELVSANDPRWKAIVRQQGRAAQEAAMKAVDTLDADSEELLSWYKAEVIRREQEPEAYADSGDDDALDTGATDDFPIGAAEQAGATDRRGNSRKTT